jgi:hypothetical protein
LRSSSEWWHEITLEEAQPLQDDVKYPIMIAFRDDSPARYPNDEDV